MIAPFILTFKNGVEGVEVKLKNMVKNKGKLDDMPVYKDSLQIAGENKMCVLYKYIQSVANNLMFSTKNVNQNSTHGPVN